MKALLAPLTRILDRISWNLKFAIVGSIALVIMILLVALSGSGELRSWRVAKAEQQGIEAFAPTLKFLLLLQQHRGLSAGALGGNAEMRESLEKKAPEVQTAAKDFEQAMALSPPEWALVTPSKDILTQWTHLRDGGLTMSGAQNFSAHTKAINDLMALIQKLDDVSSLALDPESSTYYSITAITVQMPEVSERLGKLRGMSNGILAARQITDSQRAAVAGLCGELELTWKQMRISLEYATQNNPATREKFKAFVTEMETRTTAIRKIALEDVAGGKFGVEPAAWWKMVTDTITLLVTETTQTYLPDLKSSLENRAGNARITMLSIFGGSILGCLLILVGLTALYASLRKGLDAICAGTHALSEGDFTHRIQLDAKDDLGIVSADFNRMCDKIEEMLKIVVENSHKLLDAATELQGTASAVSQDALQQSKTATTMASAVEEIARSLQAITHHSEDTEKASSNSREHAEEGGRMVLGAVDGMKEIAAIIAAAAESIHKLEERSGEIAQMISSIKEIAEQTNLLALNAAIEAARAGEQGRGFAVVADEVRKLAERTTTASAQIVQTVAAIQADTASAGASMENGVRRVNAGQQMTQQSGERMQDVCNSANDVLTHIAAINDALHEHEIANTSVARDVEIIARMSEHVSNEIGKTATTASHLNAYAQDLMRSVAGFRTRA